MQALLKLIETSELAVAAIKLCQRKNLTINHKKHDKELTPDIVQSGGFSVNFGGYGSFSKLGLGEGFETKWVIQGFNDPRGKPFSGLAVCFSGTAWTRPVKEMAGAVKTLGGEITEDRETADIVVYATSAPKLGKSTPVFVVNEALFQRALPAIKEKSSAARRTTKTLGKDVGSLWKLLSARDLGIIQQGLSLAAAIDEGWDDLVSDVKINPKTGSLERGSRFSGTAPAQVFLDVALLGLLSIASPGTKAGELRGRVKRLDVTVASIPALKGFNSLEILDIRLAPGVEAQNLSSFGSLPSLTSLTIVPDKTGWDVDAVSLASLDGLDAPALSSIRVINLKLESITALSSCRSLVDVDFSGNSLETIQSLSNSVATLRDLNLENCYAVESLDPIDGANLRRANFKNCITISSLKPLAKCQLFDELTIENCEKLTSLAGLDGKIVHGVPPEYGELEFSLEGCTSLESLVGLPTLDKSFHGLLLNNSGIKTVNGIEAAQDIRKLSADNTPLRDISALVALRDLRQISIQDSETLTDVSVLGELPTLEEVHLGSCSALTILPKHWQSDTLNEIYLANCKSLTSLGVLPETLSTLGSFSSSIDLSGCEKLTSISAIADANRLAATQVNLAGCVSLLSLNGLEGLSDLEVITLPPQIEDATALARKRGMSVTISAEELKALPSSLGGTLAVLPKLRLSISNADSLVDCSTLSGLKNMNSVDLSEVEKLKDLKWIVGLESLEALKLNPRSAAAKSAKAAKFDSIAKIRKLQSTLCTQSKLPLPDHLNPTAIKKTVTTSTATVSVKDLKAGLTSPSVDELRKALFRLSTEGDAIIFDSLVDGTNPDSAFTGNSEAIGKLFKAVKADHRGIARLALASICARAPDDAQAALQLRSEITEMDLEFPESAISDDIPSLSGFDNLKKLRISRLPSNSLSFCRGLSSLQELIIRESPALCSLEGIEDSVGMVELSIYDCQALSDLSSLSGMRKLSTLSLSATAPLTSLDFVKGLKSVTDLELPLGSNASLSPFEEAPWITGLSLQVRDACPDLSPLRQVERLKIQTEPDWYDETPRPSSPVTIPLDVTLPSLMDLSFTGGKFNFQKFKAGKLEALSFDGHCVFDTGFSGLAGIKDIQFSSWGSSTFEAQSLAGLEDCHFDNLDLVAFKDSIKDLSSLKDIASLRKLTLPQLNKKVLDSLGAVPQVEHVVCREFEGSLSWAGSFKALKILELQEAGKLTDMEALIDLPALDSVYLRNSKTKRESWPEPLRGKLDYRR